MNTNKVPPARTTPLAERSKIREAPAGMWCRPATLADGAALYAACYVERDRDHFMSVFRHSIREQERRRRIHLLAVTQQGVIGTGKLIRMPGKTEIADLMVSPLWRNQGVGTAIIQYLIAEATKWGVEMVEIGVEVNNHRALSLYRRLGFGDERRFTRPGKVGVILLSWRITPDE